MKTAVDHLSKYAEYHRDARNIATHFVGVPMIVLAVGVLLSRPSFGFLSGALVVAVATSVFYLLTDLRFGLVMSVWMTGVVTAGHSIAALSTVAWLGVGVGLFVVGWIFQFIGHYFEGRKPAFVDDLVGLVVGPMFVLAEFGFLLGLRHEVKAAVEARSGPVRRARAASKVET